MSDIDFYDGVRIRALLAVVEPDDEALMRKVCRWYSTTFSTPLRVVEEELSIEHVLVHWFEAEFERLDPDDRHNLAIYLLETPEEREARSKTNKDLEDELVQKSIAQNEKLQKKKTSADLAFERMKAKASGKVEKGLDIPSELKNLKTARDRSMPETALPGRASEPEEVKIQYMSTGDFESELDSVPGPQPRKK